MGLISALALAAALPLFSQPTLSSHPTRRKPPAVEQLVIDATVTDSTGRTVPGLSAADFEILQAGKPHQIADAAYVRARAGAPTAAAASFDALAWPAPLPGGRTDDSHLTLAVVVDDLSLSPGARS